jgi:quercetin dioxygenase-like cupin family protein
MKKILYPLGLAVVAISSVLFVRAQDAAKVDTKHYKVEFENDQVRVLRVKYGPGEKSTMHSHPDAVAIFLNDAKAKFTFPDGKTEEMTVKAGDTKWTPAMTHNPENLTDKPFEVIVVELKGKAEKK